MGTVAWVVVGLLVVLAIIGVVSYNRFVTQRNLIKDAGRTSTPSSGAGTT